jgi:hypothetical protein
MNRIVTNSRLHSSWLRSDWSSIRKVVLLATYLVGAVSVRETDSYQAGGSVLNGLREHSRQAGATRNIFGPDKVRKSPPTLAPAIAAAAAATFGMVGDGLLVVDTRKGAKMMSMMARTTPTMAPTPFDTLEPTVWTVVPTTAESTDMPVAECPPSSSSSSSGMGMSGGKGGMGMSSNTSGDMGMGGPKGGKGDEVISESDFPSISVSSLIPSISYSPAPVVKEAKSKAPIKESKSKAPVTYAPTATFSPYPTFYPTTETAMPTPKPSRGGMMRGMMSMGDMKVVPPPIPSLSPSEMKKSDKKGKGKMPKGVAPTCAPTTTTLSNATKVPVPAPTSSNSTTRAPQRRPSGNTTTRSPKAPAKAPVAPGKFFECSVHSVRSTRSVNRSYSLCFLGLATAVTLAPTLAEPVAPPPIPTATADIRIALSPWNLRYTFNQSRIPLESDTKALVNTTRDYLWRYFNNLLPELAALETQARSGQFRLTEPYEINYTTTAIYRSDPAPPVVEFDMIVAAAFDDANIVTYLELVRSLPTSNVFRTTSAVAFAMDSSNAKQGRRSKDTARTTGSVLAGASACILVVLGVVCRFRQRQQSQMLLQPANKHGHMYTATGKDDEAGHVTVAGDTYQGADSTIVSGASSARRMRQTRFAQETYLMDDGHSIASRSEWGLLPTNDGTTEEAADEQEQVQTSLLQNEAEETPQDALARTMDYTQPPSPHANGDTDNEPEELSDSEDDLSVDDDVPMRVVDLIKKFTPRKSS